jgi:hypothetical protein
MDLKTFNKKHNLSFDKDAIKQIIRNAVFRTHLQCMNPDAGEMEQARMYQDLYMLLQEQRWEIVFISDQDLLIDED